MKQVYESIKIKTRSKKTNKVANKYYFVCPIDEINSTLGTIFLANRSQDEIPLFCLIRKNKLITDIYSSIKKDDIKINKIKILSATSKMFNLEMTSDTNVYIKRIKKEKITDIIPNNSWYKWSNDEENDLLNIANKYSNMFCHTTMSFLINL